MNAVDFYSQIKTKLTKDNLTKYIIQGIAVGLASYYIPNRKSTLQEIIIISIVSSLSFLLLDTIHKC